MTAPAPVIVYDNNTTQPLPGAGEGTAVLTEMGNQITLAGTARIVTDFTFGYVVYEHVMSVVRFRANDGPKGAPNTLLFDSGPFTLTHGTSEKTLSGLRVHVPDTFTWTVSWDGKSGSGMALSGCGPPTVGACNHLWLEDVPPLAGFWVILEDSPIFQQQFFSFQARIAAMASLPHTTWSQQIVAQILTGVINDAEGLIVLGGHIVKVPPREPVEAILAALPPTLAQRLIPLIEAQPQGEDPEGALRWQLSHAIAEYQEESRG